MELTTRTIDGRPTPLLRLPDRGLLPASALIRGFDGDLMALLDDPRLPTALAAAAVAEPERFLPDGAGAACAPFRAPRKIVGIGLNYRDHAADLSERPPTEPASFIKGNHTIIGPGEEIVLTDRSERVTAEAELGLVIGRHCHRVSEEEALDHVYGVCPVLDQTAEDILQRNPRFLTMAKNFPTFFSFGPSIVPLAQLLADGRQLADVRVETVRNGEVVRANVIAQMTFSPAFLVSFLSHVMPFFPGDVISTGTPGAVPIAAGDTVECRIEGLPVLRNPVVAPAG